MGTRGLSGVLRSPPLLGTAVRSRDSPLPYALAAPSRDDHDLIGGAESGPGGRHRYDPTGPRRSLRLARTAVDGGVGSIARRQSWTKMCESCQGEQICQHGRGPPGGPMCSCSLSGPPRCPECGCPCDPWYFGLSVVGPLAINSFLGGAGDENPGFSQYPATKSQLVAAARQELTEGEVDPAEADWFAQRLPEGNLPRSRGSDDGGEPRVPVERRRRADARLEASELRRRNRHVPDRPAERDGRIHGTEGGGLGRVLPGRARHFSGIFPARRVPLTTCRSRVFPDHDPGAARVRLGAALRSEIRMHDPGTSSGRPLNVSGTVAGSVRSPGGLLEHARNSPDPTTSESVGEILSRELVPNLTRAVADREPQAVANDPAAVEDAVRSCAADIGLTTSRVTLDHVGSLPSADQMAQLRKRQQEQMANLPPEVQAMIQTRMAARAQIGTPSASPTGVAATVPRPVGPRLLPLPCRDLPRVPDTEPIVGQVLQPVWWTFGLRANCPQCGQGITPGIAFCGNCGAKIGLSGREPTDPRSWVMPEDRVLRARHA